MPASRRIAGGLMKWPYASSGGKASSLRPSGRRELQTTDKARKRKNAFQNHGIGWHFCLLRQLRLQIAVTYVYAPAALQRIAAADSVVGN